MLSKLKRFKSIKSSPARVWLVVGAGLVAFGLLFGGYNLINTWMASRDSQEQALRNNQPVNTPDPLIAGTPVHITIPDVKIDLQVIPGEYYPSTKSWTLTLDKAQWGVMTARANNKSGATFIYAHNRKNVFNTLPKIKAGNQAIVTTVNGHKFSYSFVNSTVTSPNDTSIFDYRGKPVLVLQTCTGLWYQDRQLFVFDLTNVEPKSV